MQPSLPPTDEAAQPAQHPRPAWAPTRSPQQAQRIRTQNRRLEYLRRHPEYVASSDREFVDVKLYDALIRAFQTPAERTAEARDKGFGQVLEASILRNPEPLQRVGEEEEEEEEEEDEEGESQPGKNTKGGTAIAAAAAADDDDDEDDDDYRENTIEPPPSPREAARQRWHAHVRDWFVRGGAADDGFDYPAVDDDSDYDAQARADAQDAWFEEEAPGWASTDEEKDGESSRARAGETGIQDF